MLVGEIIAVYCEECLKHVKRALQQVVIVTTVEAAADTWYRRAFCHDRSLPDHSHSAVARKSPAIETDPPPTLQAAALCFTNQHFVKLSVCVVNAYGARGEQLHTSLTWALDGDPASTKH
jgi:hypothetical protein